MSNGIMSVSGSIFCRIEFKNSMLSLKQIFILLKNGNNKMSINVLNQSVGLDGPADMGLNLRLLGSGISMYRFLYFYSFLKNFLGLFSLKFWESIKVASFWDAICLEVFFFLSVSFCILQNFVIFDMALLFMFVSIKL